MRNLFAASVVMLTTLSVVGCDSSPTIPAEAARPFHDGGVIFGSGHRSYSDSTNAGTQSNDATTQERGGVIFGSGH